MTNNPAETPLKLDCGPEAFAGLAAGLRQAIIDAAREYHARFPNEPAWVVTSARRTLRRQAELMAQMNAEQLVGMYCSHGRPQYIDALLDAWPVDAERAYAILANRTEGYISRHLFGAAADIAAEKIAYPDTFKTLLTERGAAVMDEQPLGVQCFHISWPAAPAEIVRS